MKIGCIIMASGVSRRFGENKLLTEFRGKSLIQTILDLTENESLLENNSFTKRLVLTRTPEVAAICEKQNIPVIYHERTKRNEAILLGVNEMPDMDGILFCPCDQPLLSRSSLKKMLEEYKRYFETGEKNVILRLCFGESAGTPVLFGKGNFTELRNLPDGFGGSWICKQHPERIKMVQAEKKLELFDIDTKEDLDYLLKI